jgi:phytoene dehydrogenase-like protein
MQNQTERTTAAGDQDRGLLVKSVVAIVFGLSLFFLVSRVGGDFLLFDGYFIGLVVFSSGFAPWVWFCVFDPCRPRKAVDGTDVGGAAAQGNNFQRYTDKKIQKYLSEYAPDETVDAVIIGGGIGGMACAAILARVGKKVLVLEQHDRIGGATHTFEWSKQTQTQGRASSSKEDKKSPQIKCEFDSGYHYTCQQFCDPSSRTGAMMSYLTGGKARFSDLGDPYDRVMFPGAPVRGDNEFHFVRGWDRIADALAADLTMNCSSLPPSTHAMLTSRLRIFYSLCRKATGSYPKVFLAEAMGSKLDISRIVGGLLGTAADGGSASDTFVDSGTESRYPARAPMEFWGSLSTAYVIKAVVGNGYTVDDVLAKKPLPEGADARVDAKVAEVSSGADAAMLTDPVVVRILQQAMALVVHPIGDYGVPPADSSFLAHSFVVDYYACGSSYPIGPSSTITDAMAAEVRHAGGEVFVNAQVRSIILDPATGAALGVRVCKRGADVAADNGNVVDGIAGGAEAGDTTEGVSIMAGAVVNAAGIHHLHRSFLPRQHPAVREYEKLCADGDAARVGMGTKGQQQFRPSTSHCYLFIALDGTPTSLQLEKTNMWCLRGNEVAGAGGGATGAVGGATAKRPFDIDGAFDDFYDAPFGSSTSSAPDGAGDGADGSAAALQAPAVYITFPCAKDAEWTSRFPAVSNCIVFCDAKYEWFEKWKADRLHHRSAGYSAFKAQFESMMLAVLFEKRPDLKSKVLWTETGTPLSDEYYLGAFHGGSYGTRVDCAYFSARCSQFLMRPDTRVPRLFQAGQDALTPSINGAMHGGVLAAWRMLGISGMLRSMLGVLQVQYEAELAKNGTGKAGALLAVLQKWC